MPIIKSAIKRVRQQKTRTQRNATVKNRYKSLMKEYIKLTNEGKTAEAQKLYPQVQKSIDMAVKKGLLPKNTANRKKSTLVKMLDKKPVQAVAPKKESTEKAPAKKAAPKKSAAANKKK